MRKLGHVQQKILLVLMGGVALGFSTSPRQYFRTLRMIQKGWHKINQTNFNRSVRTLSDEKLIEEKIMPDGSFCLVLTEEGKSRAKKINLFGSTIKFKKPKKWDGKWRIVIFDIPEKDRLFRDVLRAHLYTLGFFRLQHSVFVSPHPYEKAIMELVAVYSAQQYVRVITASFLDNSNILKRHFRDL